MTSLWLTQIVAVMRLEIKKSFFARRGLWIYLLALAPVALFTIQSLVERNFRLFQPEVPANGHILTQQEMDSIQDDMTRDEIIAKLGPPSSSRKRSQRRFDEEGKRIIVETEDLHYYGSRNSLILELENGILKGRISRGRLPFDRANYAFAGVFQFFYLRLAVFFGCLGIFMNLFRGEMLDKSLHYYLLSPIKREVLLAGKFLAGLVAATVIFTASTALQLLAMFSAFDSDTISRYFNQDYGLSQVVAYLGVTALACIGYGSVFLGAGLLFRNPIFPAAAVLIWEAINPLLPALLKKFSVIYYLKSLCPVQIPTDPGMPALLRVLISNGDPISAYLAVFGLLALAVLILWASSVKIRTLEINYTTE
jgi:ABC-type transport system involved in multi-copper enzyme maturation permease subunit